MFNWDFVDSVPTYHPICDGNNLQLSYKASKQGSDWKKPVQLYEWDWMGQLAILQRSLENLRLHLPNAYKTHLGHEFTIHERGKVRAITGLCIEDRIVRHSLNDFVLLPLIRPKLIYDNSASLEHRGIDFARERLRIHLHKYYKEYGNDGWIALLDISKYYDNIRHDIALSQFNEILPGGDIFTRELLQDIFHTYEVDVSYMSDEEFEEAYRGIFVMNDHRLVKFEHTGEKMLGKSVLMGDQTSQLTGVFYPHRIDNYIKIVEGNKFYGRYMDDSYIIHHDLEYLKQLVAKVIAKYKELGLYINSKKIKFCKLSDGFVFLQQKYTLLPNGYIIERMQEKNIRRERTRLKRFPASVNITQLFKSWISPRTKYLSRVQLSNLFTIYNRRIHYG